MYTLYIKKHVRTSFYKKDVSFYDACKFLSSHPYGVVRDKNDNNYYTEEELKNAESIRPVPRFEFDNGTSTSGEVSKDSHIELFGSFGRKT